MSIVTAKNSSIFINDKFGFKTIFHSFIGIGIFLVGNLLASAPFDILYTSMKIERNVVSVIIEALLKIVITFILMRIYTKKILKLSFNDLRIKTPKSISIWIVCALILPLSVSAFFIFLVPGKFASTDFTSTQIISFITGTVFNTCLAVGITEELLFRGFIMRLFEQRWNKKIAVVVPSIIFGVLHILSVEQWDVLSILQLMIAGTLVGIMFSVIVYWSDSIWASTLVHGIWNLIIIGRILHIGLDPANVIFSYVLETQSTLLTGGSFGIEASLPAIIGYGLVLLFGCMFFEKTKKDFTQLRLSAGHEWDDGTCL